MSMISIELHGPPRGKGRPRFRIIRTRSGATFGNAYTPAKTRDYENDLRQVAAKVMGKRQPISCAASVTIYAMMPIPASWSKSKRSDAAAGLIRPTTKPDWENIAKTLDAFNGVVWIDDKQVVDGRVIKLYSVTPMLRVDVEPHQNGAT